MYKLPQFSQIAEITMCTELNKSHLDIFQSSSPCSRLHPRVGGVFKMRKTKQEVEGKSPLRLTCPVWVFFFFSIGTAPKRQHSQLTRESYRQPSIDLVVVTDMNSWCGARAGGSVVFLEGEDGEAGLSAVGVTRPRWPSYTAQELNILFLLPPLQPDGDHYSGLKDLEQRVRVVGCGCVSEGSYPITTIVFFFFFYSLQSALFSCSF